MSDLLFTVTTAGRAALVNAENTGTAPVLISHCGVSPVAFAADPSATTLPAEIKRISTLAGDVVADDTIHVTVRDESPDVYSLRSLGLYLADGALFAVYSQPAVIMEKSAQAMLLLTIDIQFPDIDATSLTFGATNFLNPAATTERQGVVELATEEESTTGADALRAVTPKGLKSAVVSWLNDRFGAGAPSSFVKDLLAIASAPLFRQAIGLGNVDNTSDAAKPISTATQNALNAKADTARTITAGNGLTGGGSLAANRTVALGTPSTITTGTGNSVSAESHTHALTISKADIGLGNVDNTSDAAKPISTATQNALNGKAAITSANRPGVTRLYRRDDDTNYNIQVTWDGTRWQLRGYSGDTFHAEARVAYADFAEAAGGVAWNNVSGRPTSLSAFSNDPGYINADGRAYGRKSDGGNWNLIWAGQGAAPGHLLGSNDGVNFYAYAPSLLSVNYAVSAGYAGSAGNSDTVDGLHGSDLVQINGSQTIAGQKTFATPPVVNGAPVAAVAGSAPIYGLRAWVNFSGKGVPYIRGAGNVSSITDENVGLWTINFSTPMPDANYCPVLGCNSYGYRDGGTENIFVCSSSASWTGASLMSTTALRLMFGSNISGGGFDADYVFVGIAR